jgi:hypothetical protein
MADASSRIANFLSDISSEVDNYKIDIKIAQLQKKKSALQNSARQQKFRIKQLIKNAQLQSKKLII